MKDGMKYWTDNMNEREGLKYEGEIKGDKYW